MTEKKEKKYLSDDGGNVFTDMSGKQKLWIGIKATAVLTV